MKQRRWAVIIVIAGACVLVGWILVVSSKQIERNRRIDQEVALLETEAGKIRRENQTLAEKISYFSSDAFREQEAKNKLGLKKIGETVVIVKPAPERVAGEGVTMEQVTKETGNGMHIPNYKKWWNLFF